MGRGAKEGIEKKRRSVRSAKHQREKQGDREVKCSAGGLGDGRGDA